MTKSHTRKPNRADRPLVLANPGEMFQDHARPGAMIIGIDRTPHGRIWGCWTGTGDKRDGYMLLATSDVGGDSWSEPVLFAEGCTLNKPTVLSNRDWLLPVSDWHRKTARVFASTDEGRTWKERGALQFPDWKFDEHMMVELRDGRMWMLARTKGQPYESFSADQGASWSEPRQAATVRNLSSRFFLRRLRSGRILLVKNGSPAERLPQRSHMSAWVSDDEGGTWKGGLLLDERSAVSYPDGFEAPDGFIYILYDQKRLHSGRRRQHENDGSVEGGKHVGRIREPARPLQVLSVER